MSSEGAMPAAGPRLHHLTTWFDPESAAMVTILLGLFQVLLSVPLAYSEQNLPKIFVLPLVIGILVMTGGSFTMANERNPSRQLLKGCACSNVAGLLGALIAFCLYCYSLNTAQNKDPCLSIPSNDDFSSSSSFCPGEILRVSVLLSSNLSSLLLGTQSPLTVVVRTEQRLPSKLSVAKCLTLRSYRLLLPADIFRYL